MKNWFVAPRKRLVSRINIDEYSRKAKKYVAEKNFSKRANEEMRLYNLTMKVNRLELLKAEIGLELAAAADEQGKLTDEALNERARQELERQAGILGKTLQDNAKAANAIVNASFKNATYSERVWANQEALKQELNKLLTTGIIQGKNPRELARSLRKVFDTSVYNANRLMITELARVQTEAQKQSFERNGFEQYTYVACSDFKVCADCKALDGKHFDVDKMMPGDNAPPLHPNCRCSTAAYIDDKAYDEWLSTYKEHELSFADWKAKNKSNESKSELKKFEPAGNKKDAVAYAKENLGVKSYNASELSKDIINKTNEALYNVYRDYPELKGIVNKIEADNRGVAAFHFSYKNGKINTKLTLNPEDIRDIDMLAEQLAKEGKWTPKNGLEGVIRHEMGHALEAQRTFANAGVDMFATDVNGCTDRWETTHKYNKHEYAQEMVTKAFENLGLEPTKKAMEQEISIYGAENFSEAFAEILSDKRKGKLYQELLELIKEE